MIFPSIKKEDNGSVLIDDFSGGINKTGFNNNSLKNAKNLIFKDSALKTRPALRVCPGYLQTGMDDGAFSLNITDLTHYINGRKYNIAYYSDQNNGFYNKINVYLVCGKDEILNFGYLQISKEERDPDDIIFRPDSVVFYSGTKTKGCGIYAFAGYTASTGKKAYGVFEAKEIGDNSEWYEIAEDERYVPTILINGRGNKYDEANEHYGFNFSEPESPEKRNIISSYVKAYFSSDSYSWCFYMPEQDYDYKPLKCRVYLNSENYMDFIFDPLHRATVRYGSHTYTANFDPTSGAIGFSEGEDGKPLPIPRGVFCKENNIVLIAAKSGLTDPSTVLSCNGAVIFNSRAYLYKSDVVPNGIYSCKISNPLYFPTNMQTLVGSDIEEIKGAGYQNDKLIVFKAGETFKVNTTTAESELKFLSPDQKVRFATDSLSNESISTKVGCLDGATVASCAGQLIWLGSDKKVYTLEATTYGSEKNVFSLSEKVDDLIADALAETNRAFAMARDGYYYLFCNNSAFVCDCHITNMGYAVRYGARNMQGISWYNWELPQTELISGKNCGEIMISAAGSGKNGFLHFEDKSKDACFDFSGEPGAVNEYEIPVFLETADYNLGTNNQKIIERIVADISAGPVDIKMITDNRTANRHIHSIKDEVQINNIINGKKSTRKMSVAISSTGKFSLRSITAFFKAVK